MKQFLLAFFTLMTSVVHADSDYSGVWKDTKGQFYSIHQLADSLVIAKLSSQKTELSPFVQGNFMFTDNQLDLAISGYGFFIIELEDGSHIYTRKGDFRLAADGMIVNGQGEKLVMEKEATLPAHDFVGLIVKSNGIINLQTPEDKLIEFGRIKLASIAPRDLQYLSENRFKSINEEAVTYFYPQEERRGAIQQGVLEKLNWTEQNWVAYTGKLMDNQARINRISEQEEKVYSKEIIFSSESTATLSSIGIPYPLFSQIELEVQLIKVF